MGLCVSRFIYFISFGGSKGDYHTDWGGETDGFDSLMLAYGLRYLLAGVDSAWKQDSAGA